MQKVTKHRQPERPKFIDREPGFERKSFGGLLSTESFMPNLRPTKEEVIALETAYWDAMKAKDGSKTAALSGDPSLVSGAQGVMTIPRSKMSGMTEQGDWTLESYAFENIEISTPTPDVAIIAYTVTQEVVMKGEKKTLHAADSSTWIRGAEGWICHAHSEAYLAEAPKT